MASMMHEGPDGEHVRAYEARPTLEEHCPPVRAARGAPALWARMWAPPVTDASIGGPRSRGPEKGGRESSRSSQLPLSVKPWQVTVNACRQVTANASAADPCQTFCGGPLPDRLRRIPARPSAADTRQTFCGGHLPELLRRTPARPFAADTCQTFPGGYPPDPCQLLENVPPPASTTSGAATDAAQYRHQRPNLTAGMCISARHPA